MISENSQVQKEKYHKISHRECENPELRAESGRVDIRLGVGWAVARGSWHGVLVLRH